MSEIENSQKVGFDVHIGNIKLGNAIRPGISYYAYCRETYKYLHTDGIWRYKATNGKEFTGYYDSHDSAQAAFDSLKEK